MSIILVAVDGTERGERALAWASRHARSVRASLKLVSVVDPAVAQTYGIDEQSVESSVAGSLEEIKGAVRACGFDGEIETVVATGKVVDSIVSASAGCDMIVLGSHHGRSARR